MMIRTASVLPVLIFLLVACNNPTPGPVEFVTEPTTTAIDPNQLNEASGIADSRSMPGAVWVQQDSGSPAELALLGHDGKLRGKLPIPNATNRDWEDLAIGPGPQDGVNYIYIGEIGDNNAQHGQYTIYRLPEPANLNGVSGAVDRINFRYPDGARDAETLMIDPQTRDIYIVSKNEERVRLYRLPYPQNTTELTTAEALGELPINGTQLQSKVTGGAISASGSEILLRTYFFVYYWSRNQGQSVADAMQRTTARELPHRIEPQGEAICFGRSDRGFFTLSEKANGINPTLNYYAKR
jgi:hypothetical protein